MTSEPAELQTMNDFLEQLSERGLNNLLWLAIEMDLRESRSMAPAVKAANG
jgi:hypothetical protein